MTKLEAESLPCGRVRPAGAHQPRRRDQASLVSCLAMPLRKRPFVASPDQVRITRDGDDAIIEYADQTVATTHLRVGAEKLAAMTDEQLLDFWNEMIEAREAHREGVVYTATEVPAGKPQVRYFEDGDQWVPRGHVLRCEILSDAAIEPSLEEPFVSIDGRDFTLAEFMRMVGTFGGWGMRVEFVPNDELYERPKLKVRDPDDKKRNRTFTRRRT